MLAAVAASLRRRRGSHDDIPLASHLPVDAAAALRRHRRVARWLGFPSTERPSRLLQLSLPAGGLSLLGSFGVVLVAARRTWFGGHGTVLGRGSLGPRRRRGDGGGSLVCGFSLPCCLSHSLPVLLDGSPSQS